MAEEETNTDAWQLDPIEDVIADVKAGKMVIIVDDQHRENEGDLMVASQLVTAEQIAFMSKEGRGLICLSLMPELVNKLKLPLQTSVNKSSFGTNFTVTFDHESVRQKGVSASGRAVSIRRAVADDAVAQEFIRPGHIVPLQVVPGGVLKRQGQTEGSADIAKFAGLKPSGVICEVMGEDGTMVRGKALHQFALKHGLLTTSVEALRRYKLEHEICLRQVAEGSIRDFAGVGIGREAEEFFSSLNEEMRVVVYEDDADGEEHLAFIKGDLKNGCLARIHSECLTGDVFGSLRCDCGYQLSEAFRMILNDGCGVVVYLHQEGRGIGLGNKIRAYSLQDKGMDTVDANIALGFDPDLRDYRAGAHILRDLGLTSVRLITNNPEKISEVEQAGCKVEERVEIPARCDDYNRRYLETKKKRFGHLLSDI